MERMWFDLLHDFQSEMFARKKVNQIGRNFHRLNNNSERMRYAESLVQKHNRIFKWKPSPNGRLKKNDVKSVSYRVEGNNLLKQGKCCEALSLYNKSICFAESEEVIAIGYSNRSAVLFEMGRFHDCLENIRMARDFKSLPDNLVSKLDKRQEQCLQRQIESEKPNKKGELSYKTHPKLPFIVDRIEIRKDGNDSWLYAKEYLDPGVVIAREKAFGALISPEEQKFICYYCLRAYANLIPCPNCTLALFCDENCLRQATDEFHKWECPVAELLTFFDVRLLFSLRILLKMVHAFGDFGELDKYWKDVAKRQVNWFDFDKTKYGIAEHFIVFHSLAHKTEAFTELENSAMVNMAIGAAFLKRELLKHSDLKSIFQTEQQQNLLGDILYHHMLILEISPANIIVGRSALDYNSGITEAYSVIKEIKLSNNPNVNIVWADHHIVFVTTRPVLKGEDLQMPSLDSDDDEDEDASLRDLEKLLFLNMLVSPRSNRRSRPNHPVF